MYSVAETMDEIERGVDFGEFEPLWQTLKAAVLAQQTNNSAMVQLLREARGHLCKLQGHGDLTSRIDVVLAQQHQ